MFQWLRLCFPNGRGLGSIPGQGTKILHCATASLHATAKSLYCTKTCHSQINTYLIKKKRLSSHMGGGAQVLAVLPVSGGPGVPWDTVMTIGLGRPLRVFWGPCAFILSLLGVMRRESGCWVSGPS